MALVFGGLLGGVKLMLSLIGDSKAETGARSLALSRLEYIRSLDYEAIGTVNGIPSGAIRQVSTTTLNGIEYTERVLVLYIDRAEDGLEEDDENGVLEDSKRVKVEYSWESRGTERHLALTTDVAPKGMETSSGGGTLIVKVFDADVLPVPNATVRVTNNSVATNTIDITLETNSEGRAIIPGAPALGGYHIAVSKNGYSSAGTYPATAGNPNPNPPAVAVASSTISTMPFFIDELAEVALRTVGEPVVREIADEFDDGSMIVEAAGAIAAGGGLTLESDGAAGYVGSGTAYSSAIAPADLHAWQSFDWESDAPGGTDLRVHLYAEAGGVRTIVPDTVLPGNEAGFVSGPVDIGALAVETYPQLALGAALSSNDSSVTPTLDRWSLSYVESEPPIPNVSFRFAGTKTIGINVLKYDETIATDAAGEADEMLEWDNYSVTLNSAGYVIKEVRGNTLPLNLLPGSQNDITFVLVPPPARSLHITVVDSSGAPVSNASVKVTAGGYDKTIDTSAFGQAFFGDLPAAAAYAIAIEHDGFEDYSAALPISGNVMTRISLISI